MIISIYKKSINILLKMPFKLWGLSLLNGFLSILIMLFGALPIITIPTIAVLNAGMAAVYLDGYRGKEVYSDQLFSGFKNFTHVAGGMCWKELWVLLWFLVPVAGPVIAIIKSISYSFTPYILNEEKSVNATEALRKSMADTKGYKTSIFAATVLPALAFAIVFAILGALSMIPFVGFVFAFINFLVMLVFSLFAPLFFGLVRAGFYEYAKNPSSAYVQPSITQYTAQVQTDTAQAEPSGDSKICSVCDAENAPGTAFCFKCGAKLD